MLGFTSGMLIVRLAWADIEGKCLSTLVVGRSRVLDFRNTPCVPKYLPHTPPPQQLHAAANTLLLTEPRRSLQT